MNADQPSTGEPYADPPNAGGGGPLEARYLTFLETIAQLRPSLHRYCSRMTGSVLDGEDVVQDALLPGERYTDCQGGGP